MIPHDVGRGDPEAQGSRLCRSAEREGQSPAVKHATTGKEIWIAVHTKKDAGQLGNRILREAGIS